VILIATGSEVGLCVKAYEELTTQGIKARVVSMPSWEIFDDYCQKDPAYHESVLPANVTARVSVEQASTFGWERYVGTSGAIIGMKTFGASAPLKELTKKFGFTVDNVVDTAKEQIRNNERR
jgi:transketolase